MLALHIMYLLVGASIFYHIESPLEVAARAEDKLERLEIQSKSLKNTSYFYKCFATVVSK